MSTATLTTITTVTTAAAAATTAPASLPAAAPGDASFGMTPVLTGFGTGLGLIVAIGAQNAWVLRQGVRREHIGLVIAICALSDLVLITVGTGAIRAVTGLAPWALEALRWGGAIYLAAFAVSSFRSALRPGALEESAARPAASVAATTLALTWLNPHVYLDTVLMLGTVTNDFGPVRWWAAAGACAASVVWFAGLGLGARALSGPLSSPRTWRVVDVLVGCVMLGVAAHLALGA